MRTWARCGRDAGTKVAYGGALMERGTAIANCAEREGSKPRLRKYDEIV